jgi:hypothetical protein
MKELSFRHVERNNKLGVRNLQVLLKEAKKSRLEI